MEFMLAKTDFGDKAKKITLEKLLEEVNPLSDKVLYFDGSNSHKDLIKLASKFEGKGRKAYLSEVKYGLDEKDFIYELHVI